MVEQAERDFRYATGRPYTLNAANETTARTLNKHPYDKGYITSKGRAFARARAALLVLLSHEDVIDSLDLPNQAGNGNLLPRGWMRQHFGDPANNDVLDKVFTQAEADIQRSAKEIINGNNNEPTREEYRAFVKDIAQQNSNVLFIKDPYSPDRGLIGWNPIRRWGDSDMLAKRTWAPLLAFLQRKIEKTQMIGEVAFDSSMHQDFAGDRGDRQNGGLPRTLRN